MPLHWFVRRLLSSFAPKHFVDRTWVALSWATKSHWKAGYISSGLAQHEQQQQPQRMLVNYCRHGLLLLPVSQSICPVLWRYVQRSRNRKCQYLQKTKLLCTEKGRDSSRSLPMALHVLRGAERTVSVLSLSVEVGDDVLPHQQPQKGRATVWRSREERGWIPLQYS